MPSCHPSVRCPNTGCLSCPLACRAISAAFYPVCHPRMAVELDAHHGAQYKPAGGRNIDEREGVKQMLAIRQTRLQRIESADELRSVVFGARPAAVFGLVRERRVEPMVEILHHVIAELGHRPDVPTNCVGPGLARAGWPKSLFDAVLVAEIQHNRTRFKKRQFAVGEPGHLPTRTDRKVLRCSMLEL